MTDTYSEREDEENEDDEYENATRSFSVFVQDSDDHPVSGVAVTCDGGIFNTSETNETDGSGHAYFTDWPYQDAASFVVYVSGVEMGSFGVEEDDEDAITVTYDP